MTDIKQLAKNLRRYKRRKLIERLREAAAQRVASTAMIGADDLIAAADALEIATAGMNAYCDELGSCRKAAGFGSADDPMAQEGFGAFSDPLCVAAFVESQFKRIVAERAALAAELKSLREQEPVGIVDEGDDGVFADLETTSGVIVKLGDKLYARPVPCQDTADMVNKAFQDGINSGYAQAMEEEIARSRQVDPSTLPERDESKPAESQGLFRKFEVRRVDGSDKHGGKHHGCRYFVLDLDHDQHADAAMAAELKAMGPKGPSYMPNWTNHGAAIADPVFHQIRGIMGTQNWGQEDALRKAVLHALRAFQRSVEASNQPTEAGHEND